MTSSEDKSFDALWSEVQTLADEVRLKAHLAGKDLEDAIERHQGALSDLQHRLEKARDEAGQRAPEVEAAMKEAASQVADGFRAVLKALRSRS